MSGKPDPNIRALAVGQSRDLVIEITGSKKTISVIVWTASCRVKGISPHLFIHNLQGVRMKATRFLARRSPRHSTGIESGYGACRELVCHA